LIAALGWSLGCGDGGSPPDIPTPGLLGLSLSSPNTNDGALLLTITGGVVTDVQPATGYTLASAGTGTSTVRVVLTGSVSSGLVAQISVPDTRKAGSYLISVDQAAARGTYAIQNVSGYLIQVVP
jgi:hypothetical protein